jgi:hypothetical protein
MIRMVKHCLNPRNSLSAAIYLDQHNAPFRFAQQRIGSAPFTLPNLLVNFGQEAYRRSASLGERHRTAIVIATSPR